MADLGKWTCRSGKIPHKTRDGAAGQLRSLRATKKGKDMRVYRCDECGNWHVGHPRGMQWKKHVLRHGNPGERMPKCS